MGSELVFKKYERLALASKETKDWKPYFALALLYDMKSLSKEAVQSIQKALELAPKNSAVFFLEGILLTRHSRHIELAISEWIKAFEFDFQIREHFKSEIPEEIHYPLKETLAYTLATFESEVNQSASSEYIDACLAFARGILGDPKTGLESFDKMDELTKPQPLYLYALLLLSTSRWEEAAKALEKILQLDKTKATPYYLLGTAYLKSEKIPLSVRAMERALVLDSHHAEAQRALGEVYYKQGKFAQAIGILEKISPATKETHYLIGRCQQALYQYGLAVASYKAAIKLGYRDDASFHLGVALSNLGRWPEAVEALNEAAAVEPNDAEVYYHLGIAQTNAGNDDDAMSAFQKSIDLNPSDSFAHYNLGLAYEKLGRLEAAIYSYKKALEINPKESYPRYHLALCYQRLGDYTLAMAELENAVRVNPQDAYAAYSLGSVYAFLGFSEKALKAYAKASELNPNNVYTHFNIGAILARDGMIKEANEAFKKALELSPANDAELALYSTLASQMAVNIEIAKLNEKIKESYMETVKAIIGCLDAKDPYTAGHTNRVSVIATEIGKKIGLSRDEMDSLSIAAVLHDIGKLGVPDAILLKQGKLTTDEFTVMKEHPVTGAKILEQVSFPWSKVGEYVKHHHERFDGSGYPGGLKGDAIPIGARILALADFFDALATERPYKKAFPIPVVISEAEAQSGKSFDPDVIRALKEVTEKLQTLYQPAEELKGKPTWESSWVDSA